MTIAWTFVRLISARGEIRATSDETLSDGEFARWTIGPRTSRPSPRREVGAEFIELRLFTEIGLPSSTG